MIIDNVITGSIIHSCIFSMAQFYPPLKERIIKSKSTCVIVPPDTKAATVSRGAYKGWNEENMVRAVESLLKKNTKQQRSMIFLNQQLLIE